jgi:hypothetical protein
MTPLRPTRTHVVIAVVVGLLALGTAGWMSLGSSPSSGAVARGPDSSLPPTTLPATTTTAPATTTTATEPPPTVPPTTLPPVVPDSPFPPADPVHPGLIVDPTIDRPDPSIVWDAASGQYWMFTTNQWYAHVPSWRAPSPTGPWTWAGDALPSPPKWAVDDGIHLWAPDVVAFNGVWSMWGSAFEAATQRMCLYRAVAPTVAGPYTVDPAEPGLCTKSQGGSIDPQQLQDDHGAWWMLFKVDGNEIAATTSIVTVRLDGAGHPVGQPKILLSSDQPWEGGLIESPAMVKDVKRNQWWLLFSAGNFSGPDTNYQIAATRCAGPAGPCSDQPGPLLQSNFQGLGPGEEGVFVDPAGTIWMTYGPWAPFVKDKPRPLVLVKIGFFSNGLLYPGTP